MVPAVAIIYFDLDPLYYVIIHGFNPEFRNIPAVSNALVGIRLLAGLAYILSITRVTTFMCFSGVLGFHAYFGSCKLMTGCRSLFQVVDFYKRLSTAHAHLFNFFKETNALILFMGHTCSICMFWVSIRGWDLAHHLIIAFFPVGGFIIMMWALTLLVVQSGVMQISEGVLHEIKVRMKTERQQRNRRILQAEIRRLQPITLKVGNLFTINQDSPGNSLMTMLDNLISAVMTFH